MSQDAPSAPPGPSAEAPAPGPSLVAWPPPGLERLRGDVWGVIDRLGTGGAIFTLPLLAAITLPQDQWRPGIFGDAWWVVLLTSVAGLWILTAGYVELFRSLRRARAATGRGYRSRTVFLVLSDRPGDSGFLIQGARAYSLIDREVRARLLDGRLAQAGLLLGATTWLSVGFMVGVVLATRGALGAGGLALWVFFPPVLAAAAVVLLRALENSVIRKARKEWHAKPWSEDLGKDEIKAWHAAVGAQDAAVAVPEASSMTGNGTLRGAAVATAFVAVAIPVLTVPLIITSGVGPLLGAVAIPRYSTTATRAATSEALAPFEIPTDPTVTPRQAGDALRAVVSSDDPMFTAPPRTHDDLFPNDEYQQNPTGMEPHFWPTRLMPQLAEGLEPDVVTYLQGLAESPALQELDMMARARSLDDAGAFYTLPLPQDLSVWDLPIPRYSGLREVAYAEVGAAVGEAAAGRVDDAEARLRELISAGRLMGLEGSTLIANLVGYVIANAGGEALASLYDATGRVVEAAALRDRIATAERAARMGQSASGAADIASLSDVVTDDLAVRGMRWEYFITLNTLGPCLNLHRAVFGPSEEYDAWVDQARSGLVRSDGEGAIFELAERGWGLPQAEGSLPSLARFVGRLVGGGVGSCTDLAASAASDM